MIPRWFPPKLRGGAATVGAWVRPPLDVEAFSPLVLPRGQRKQARLEEAP